MNRKYAFVDRDGTLIYEPQDTFQIDSIEKLKILDGAISGLKKLQKQGYKLVMVSNQDGLGTDSFPLEEFEAPQNEMMRIFNDAGIDFDQVLICPHHPSENCECRKPKLGLVKDLQDIDKNKSIMIGDRETDIKFAVNLGIKGLKVKTNEGLNGLRI